ncbi:hypothetical protein [Rathayibacter soli]|uniref:hypothetical protein n=1 Tax=Rathayibacter soli TaxID=3144168 RepID=UPI0027E585C7|nr:hypothetical protein [Glaciibacter superstes]
MADLHVHRDRLEIHLTRAEKVLALRASDLVVAREDIRSTQITEDPWVWIRGVPSPGTNVPLALAIGCWKFHGGTDFLLVKGKQRSAVVIDLEPTADTGDGRFARIIVSTPHAAGLVEALRIDPSDPEAAEADATF